MKNLLPNSLITLALFASLCSCSSQDEKNSKFVAKDSKDATVAKDSKPKEQKSKFDQISDLHPELSTFVELVNIAQLKEVFNGTGPFTVFAPTNDAFEKMGKKLSELKKPESRDKLTHLLIYHVLPGKYMSQNMKSMEHRTINGKPVTISVDGDKIKVNEATVVKKDLIGPNGVIDEIDAVLIP